MEKKKSNNKESKHEERTQKRKQIKKKKWREKGKRSKFFLSEFFLNRNKEVETKETRFFQKRDWKHTQIATFFDIMHEKRIYNTKW